MSEQRVKWEELEGRIRERCYDEIESQPEFLLEHDGGPYAIKADLIYARLIGFDEQIVKDGWVLSRIEPDLRLPIPVALRATTEASPDELSMRVAKYVLQSGWASTSVAAFDYGVMDCPVKIGPPHFMVKLLYLRYRRRA